MMCTVSLIPLADPVGCRLVCNRDEQRTRPAALPPQRRSFGKRTAIMPIDPESDGTWIAATDAGLVLALLNVNESDRPGKTSVPARRSRGHIVPALLEHATIDEVFRAALMIDAGQFDPFRLLVVSLNGRIEVVSDGRRVRCGQAMVGNALAVFSSSGLGDDQVIGPRQELFDDLCDRAACLAEAQQAFHSHRWRERPQLSVLMSRAAARTVSRTSVDLHASHVALRYEALDETGSITHLSSQVLVFDEAGAARV